jgi:hypothetical protein
MFKNCLHTILHNPSSNGPLVIALKVKAKLKFLTAAILLFSILQKNTTKKNVAHFLKTNYRMSFQNFILSGAFVAPTWGYCVSRYYWM